MFGLFYKIKILSAILLISFILSACGQNKVGTMNPQAQYPGYPGYNQYNQYPGQYQQNYAPPYPPNIYYGNPPPQYNQNSAYAYGYQYQPASRYYNNPYAIAPAQSVYNDQDQYYQPPTSYGSYEAQNNQNNQRYNQTRPSAYNSASGTFGER